MFYLKYRPQTIAELDNKRIAETLGKALLQNQWSHAYLLIGTRGSGKTTTARLIAKIVNCLKRKKGEEPCNKCDSCIAIAAGRSLDVIEIDAASNTGVDDIRDLREKVKLAPVSSRKKVYIIDEVHMLSTSAFNALLKTLEEPPEHVIFVLATTEAQKLPATIVSRCLVYDFGKASESEILASLRRKVKAEGIKATEEALSLIAKSAEGSFRDADKFLEQLSLIGGELTAEDVKKIQSPGSSSQAVKEILNHLLEKDARGALSVIESFVQMNGSVKLLMLELTEYLKGLLLLRSGIEVEIEEIPFNQTEITNLIWRLVETSGLIKDSPVVQLPLEMIVIEFCQERKTEDTSGKIGAEKQKDGKKVDERVAKTETRQEVFSELEKIWSEVLDGVKPFNHSLLALLRASRLQNLDGDLLTIEVFYKFHKDRLSEHKNREILEKVVSDIMGREIKVRFELSDKQK